MVDHKMNDIEKKFKPICCHVCQRTFTVKQSLNRHIQVVHEKLKPFPCNICQKTFKRKDSLIGHIQTIHEVFTQHFDIVDCNGTLKMFTKK